MIIHNLHVMRLAIAPSEANQPSIVDPDAVLSPPVRLERFETVARRNPKIFEPPRRLKVEQLAARRTLDGREARHSPIAKKRLGVPASERSDHSPVYDATGIPSNGTSEGQAVEQPACLCETPRKRR